MCFSNSQKGLVARAKVYFLLIIMFCFNHFAKSQQNVLYLEAGGAGGYGSLNYEKLIDINKKIQVAARAGISSYRLLDYTNVFNPDIIMPIGVSMLYGKHKHRLEVGGGEAFVSMVQFDYMHWKPRRIVYTHVYSSVGYRYQKRQKGIVIRLFYVRMLEFSKYVRHWGGCSIGYAF